MMPVNETTVLRMVGKRVGNVVAGLCKRSILWYTFLSKLNVRLVGYI